MEASMKVYILSLAAGLLVGVIYNLIGVRSPAPPVVALVGLLGILVGEQLPPMVKALWLRQPIALSWLHQVKPHVFGHLPKGGTIAQAVGAGTIDRRAAEGSPTRARS
jgi:XapX domain-containing protein